jgi:hypothetical protein
MPKSPFDEGFDGKVGDVVETPVVQSTNVPALPQAPVRVVVNPPVAKAAAPKALNGGVQAAQSAPATQAVLAGEQAPVAPAFDQNALGQLLQYLILKEGREAATAAQMEERRKQIQKQRDRNAKDQDSKILLKQARCKHLKGGKRGPKTQNKDYAVYQHRFIAFTTYIRCRICGMKWFPKDTADYLVREDKSGKERRISNHTHKGWREAVEMVDGSTDTASASESIPNVAPNATNIDAAGLEFDNRFIDKVTGEAIEGVVI